MNKATTRLPKSPKWKFIKIIDEGSIIGSFELNDQEKLAKKFPKMKPRKLIYEMPKLKTNLNPPLAQGVLNCQEQVHDFNYPNSKSNLSSKWQFRWRWKRYMLEFHF